MTKNLLIASALLALHSGVSMAADTDQQPIPTEPAQSQQSQQSQQATQGASLQQLIIQYTNNERTSRGLNALVPESRLKKAAQHQANNMAERNELAHTIPDADLPSLEDRIEHYGYQGSYYGENIAYGPTTARDVVTMWMNSEGHRANILNPSYQNIGVGVAYYTADGSNTPFYSQVFGTPLNEMAKLVVDKFLGIAMN